MQKKSFDLLWVEKELLPWFPSGIETLFKPSQIPYVVDYDDAVFHRYDMHSFTPVRWLLGKKIDHVMRRAKLVIAGNEYIAERARKAGAHQRGVFAECCGCQPIYVQPKRSRLHFQNRMDRFTGHCPISGYDP